VVERVVFHVVLLGRFAPDRTRARTVARAAIVCGRFATPCESHDSSNAGAVPSYARWTPST